MYTTFHFYLQILLRIIITLIDYFSIIISNKYTTNISFPVSCSFRKTTEKKCAIHQNRKRFVLKKCPLVLDWCYFHFRASKKARNSYITAFLAYILLLANRAFHLITNQPIQLNRIFHR